MVSFYIGMVQSKIQSNCFKTIDRLNGVMIQITGDRRLDVTSTIENIFENMWVMT